MSRVTKGGLSYALALSRLAKKLCRRKAMTRTSTSDSLVKKPCRRLQPSKSSQAAQFGTSRSMAQVRTSHFAQ